MKKCKFNNHTPLWVTVHSHNKCAVCPGEEIIITSNTGWTSVNTHESFFDRFGELKALRCLIHYSNVPEVCAPHPLPFRSYFHDYPDFCSGLKNADLHPNKLYGKFVSQLSEVTKNVLFYDPNKHLCSNGNCKLFHENKLLYTDSTHLSIYGSQFLFKDFEKKLNNSN